MGDDRDFCEKDCFRGPRDRGPDRCEPCIDNCCNDNCNEGGSGHIILILVVLYLLFCNNNGKGGCGGGGGLFGGLF